MAANIIFNAKTQRIGVCNACESLVIHSGIINKALPVIKERLDTKNVEMRGDERAVIAANGVLPASDEDFAEEYLDYIISVKTVDSLDEAIRHINKYSTKHSEAIITQIRKMQTNFLQGLILRRFMLMPPQDLRMAANSALAPKSAFQPKSFMQEALWA